MGIKILGATTGSINLDVPASVSGNIDFTLPTNTGSADQLLVTDGSGNLSFKTVNSATRNMVINGDMQVAERSTAAVSNTNFFSSNIGYEAIDRWGHWASGQNKFTVQQVADAPPGFYNSLKVTSLAATTLGASDGYAIAQRIEAQDLYSACLGTANAKNLVVSFWVKSTTTGTFSFYALGYGLGDSFAQNFTINSADTWEYKTINIPGPTSGNYFSHPSDYGLEIGFTLGAGIDWQTSTLGSWQNSFFKFSSTTATNVLGVATRTLQLTGVQLEVSDSASKYQHESYAENLAKCQRYFQRVKSQNNNARMAVAGNGSVSSCFPTCYLQTAMRSQPSLRYSAFSDFTNEGIAGGGIGTVTNLAFNASSTQAVTINSSASGGSTAATGAQILANNSTGWIAFEAEL
tara:strand:- start:19 stop:1233 length:1215 start_codon:yes stop_codon:yes gene_type:complete